MMSYKPDVVLCAMVLMLSGAVSAIGQSDEPQPATPLRDLHIEYLGALKDHHNHLMEVAENALAIQKVQTIAIAVAVALMAFAGLVLSILQFVRDIGSDRRSATTITLGAGSVEISSSVIGLVILALSFWFFQAYVDKVYTLNRIDIPQIAPSHFADDPVPVPDAMFQLSKT